MVKFYAVISDRDAKRARLLEELFKVQKKTKQAIQEMSYSDLMHARKNLKPVFDRIFIADEIERGLDE